MTKDVAKTVIAITWVIAIFIGLLPVLGWHKKNEAFVKCSFRAVIDMTYMVYLMFFGVYIPSLVFMMAIYAYIFYVIRKQQRRPVIQLVVLFQNERGNAGRQKREVRGAKGLAYVIVVFAVCWMPIHIMNAVVLFAPEKSPTRREMLAALWLSHVKSFINPFLYAFSNSKIKRAVGSILFYEFSPKKFSPDSDWRTTASSRASKRPEESAKGWCSAKGNRRISDETELAGEVSTA